MNELLILGGITLGAWLSLLFLRVPSSVAFLSVLIGQLLANQASDDVYDFVSAVAQINDPQYVKIGLQVLPLLLTALLMRNRVPKNKLYVEGVPILLVSALTIMLLGPLVPALNTLLITATHNQVDAYKSIIVVAASVAALLSAWLSYPKVHHDKEKKHH